MTTPLTGNGESNNPSGVIEEIVVTAQKREQAISDVPITIRLTESYNF